MAVPYLPLGISAAVLGGILLWGRTAGATPVDSDKGGEKKPQGGGLIPVNPGRFPAGTAVGIVIVKPGDPGLQGRQPGLRINNQPKPRADGAGQAAPGSTGDEIPSGERMAVLSEEITDSHGRKWRQVRTLTGVTGYAAFVDPDGVTLNVEKAPESAPWPGEGGGARPEQEIPIAGLPAAFLAARIAGSPSPSPRVGACGPVAAYPYAYAQPGLGWAPWGAGWAGNVPRLDIIGQAPGGYAQCIKACPVYEQPGGRGYPWTITSTIPAGGTVQVLAMAGGPGANYAYVQHGDRAGWTSRANLRAFNPRPRPRVYGRYRPGGAVLQRPGPFTPPVLR